MAGFALLLAVILWENLLPPGSSLLESLSSGEYI